jgi:hypothetical protein
MENPTNVDISSKLSTILKTLNGEKLIKSKSSSIIYTAFIGENRFKTINSELIYEIYNQGLSKKISGASYTRHFNENFIKYEADINILLNIYREDPLTRIKIYTESKRIEIEDFKNCSLRGQFILNYEILDQIRIINSSNELIVRNLPSLSHEKFEEILKKTDNELLDKINLMYEEKILISV